MTETRSEQGDGSPSEAPDEATVAVLPGAEASTAGPADGAEPGDDPADGEAVAPRSDADTSAGEDEQGSRAAGGDRAARGRRRPSRSVLVTFGGGVLVGAVVIALVGAFVWPGHLFGPGAPDAVASQATGALGAKDRATIDRLACRGPDGASVVSGDILDVISAAKPAGPAKVVIDTEAHAPVDLTVSYQGQSQVLPIDLVLGVSHGSWCFKSITQRS